MADPDRGPGRGGPDQDQDGQDDGRQEGRLQRWARSETGVIETCTDPERIRREVRHAALYGATEFWWQPSAQPNSWPLDAIKRAISRRQDLLAEGSQGETALRARSFNGEEIKAASPELSADQREELIATLEQGYLETTYIGGLVESVNQLYGADSDHRSEVGLFGNWREAVAMIDMFDAFSTMEATYKDGTPFQRKVMIGLRALDDVASGRTPLPRVFAEEPERGFEWLTIGYMFRSVVGYERARPFWERSRLRQFREPGAYVDPRSLAVSLDDINRGAAARDLSEEEKEILASEKGGGIPNLREFVAKIKADPELADSYDACLVSWLLYRFLRRSVYTSIKPTGEVVRSGDEYNTFMEMEPGTPLWHVETTESIAALMHLNLRLLEEGLRDRARWSGPTALMGVVPNLSTTVDRTMIISRRAKTGPRDTQRVSIEDFLFRASVPDAATGGERPTDFTDLPWSAAWLEEEHVVLLENVLCDAEAEKEMETRKTEIGETVSRELAGRIPRALANEQARLGVAVLNEGQRSTLERRLKREIRDGIKQPLVERARRRLRERDWSSPQMPRRDIELYQRLTQMYNTTLFWNQIMKPERGGYEDVLKNLLSVEWQRANAKPSDTGLFVLGLAQGLSEVEARQFADQVMANCFGAIIYECFFPKNPIADRVAFTRKTMRSVPQAQSLELKRGMGTGESVINSNISQVINAAMRAGIFPQPDLASTPAERQELVRRLELIEKAIAFVAKNGRGLLPGDVPEWWSANPSEGARVARKISNSDFFRPYHRLSRPKVAARFRDFGKEREEIPGVFKNKAFD